MEDRFERLKIHFFYCAVILTLIIIAIATDRWTLQPKFTEFLSNAATMTSLVLGLVAIFYSFIANDGLSKSLGSLGTVSQEVKASREEISKQVALGASTTQAAERSAQLIERASTDIASNLSSLSQALSSIQQHTEFLHGSLGNLPTRIDQLETKLIDATKSVGTKATASSPPTGRVALDAAIVKRFLQRASLAGDLLAYACVLAHQNGRKLNITEFCQAAELKLESFMSGFMDCMDAVDIVSVTKVEGQARTFEIARVHAALAEGAKTYFTGYIDRNLKEREPENFKRWQQALERVEALFARAGGDA